MYTCVYVCACVRVRRTYDVRRTCIYIINIVCSVKVDLTSISESFYDNRFQYMYLIIFYYHYMLLILHEKAIYYPRLGNLG